MSAPGSVPSPWGEPAPTPPVTTTAAPAGSGLEQTGLQVTGPARNANVPVSRTPVARRSVRRFEDPRQWERVRAATTLAVVAIILGATAAGVLGVSVWAIAALFHHAASG